MRALFLVLGLAACGPPPPETVETLTWPVRLPGLVTEDLRVALRQTEIARLFRADPSGLSADMAQRGGPRLDRAMAIAGVPVNERAALLAEIAAGSGTGAPDPDALAWRIARAGRAPNLEW